MLQYERRLPHWDAPERPVFVTFRLYGSLPEGRVFLADGLSGGRAFVTLDRILDTARTGPRLLGRSEIARVVMEAVRDGECRFGRYRLHSFVVMPNHVHLMVTAHAPLARWLGSLKGFTAHAANQILGLTGRPFWQDESFDHVVRSERELERIRAYIEENPVRAGLAAAAREFPWSSASLGGVYRPPEGGVVSS